MVARTEAMQAFLKQHGWGDAARHPLAGDASFRRYIRLKRGGEQAMLMDAPPPQERVAPYVEVARHLHAHGHSAPRLLAVEEAQGFVLMEDLGDALYTQTLAAGSANEEALYAAAVDVLAQWERTPAMRKPHAGLGIDDYTPETYLREAALFSEWLLPELNPHAPAEEYLALWRGLLADAALQDNLFVHRDYHADNLLWLAGGNVGLLDFQDALWGHAAYDLVSLLEDARRDVPPALAARMLARYMEKTQAPREEFLRAYALLGAQRNLKILGIFTRLDKRDGKPRYRAYMPRVWAHLRKDLAHPALSPLRQWMERFIPPPPERGRVGEGVERV